MGITSVSSSQVMRQQPSQADKEKIAAAAKKAGIKVTEGQKPSDQDIQKLKKAGIKVPEGQKPSDQDIQKLKKAGIDIKA